MNWQSIRENPAWPWVLGVALSTLGMEFGFQWGNAVADITGGEPGIWERIGKGFVWGGVIGGLQWPVVRGRGVPFVRTLLFSAAALAIGYPLGQTVQAAFTLQLGLPMIGYWSAITVFGLSLGLAQWVVFRGRVRRAGLWILCSLAGWLASGALWLTNGSAGIEYGAIAGLGLAWLARTPADARTGPLAQEGLGSVPDRS